MANNDVNLRNLQTEYLENPLGIDATKPALSWQIAAEGRGISQTAYQVQVAYNIADLQADNSLWDSNKVSSQSTAAAYAGPELISAARYYWRVRAWDQKDIPSEWSEPAWWEMGLLKEQEWQAEWIEVGWDENPKTYNPSPYFRKEFSIDSEIQSARLYITSHGLYETWLNGQRVGDQVFTPGYTPYDKMLQYQVYDVTGLVTQGENALGAILGDGWYRGKIYVTASRNVYGSRLGLLALLRIETSDGQITIASGPDWKVSYGPILKSDMKDGEIYDARLEMPGWSSPGFDERVQSPETTWKAVRAVSHPKDQLVASMGVPIRRKETFHPKVIRTPNGETVLDFGQNLAGVVRFKVNGPRGTEILLRHGEALDKDGNFTTAHLMVGNNPEKNPFQQVRYILKGAGEEEFEPHFTVHGFRYALLAGYPGEPKPTDFSAVAIYSDMPRTGTFECSDPLINQLHHNTLWSMKSNFLDLPTDCPQRERAGWTGDAQIFTPSASFLMDTRAFFRKWLKELRIEQRADGMLGNFVPNPYRLSRSFITLTDGSSGWGDAAVLIPWYLYQAYGDRNILESQYESMQGWVDYIQQRAQNKTWLRHLTPGYLFDQKRRARKHLIWDTNYHWGEWLEPGDGEPVKLITGIFSRLFFGSPLVATAYYAFSTRILAQTAQILGKEEDAVKYQRLADEIKTAYIAEFIGEDGRISPDRQASYARVLAFDLVTDELRPLVIEHLVRLVQASDNHIGTGFLTTPLLCHVLQENGRLDLAYELINQKTIPSWLYEVTKGATTIWEGWEGIKPDGSVATLSLNHYSPGAVVDFLHKKIAGIAPLEPGYQRISIHPLPGGGLTYAKATYDSVHGLIACEWKQTQSGMQVNLTIPANTCATLILPGAVLEEVSESGSAIAGAPGVTAAVQVGKDVQAELGSGTYTFIYPS